MLAEQSSEMGGIGKATFLRDLGDGALGMGEQPLRLTQAEVTRERHHALAGLCMKGTLQLTYANAHGLGKAWHRGWIGEVLLDEQDHTLNARIGNGTVE